MKRWILALSLLAVAVPASAFWQSRDSNYNKNTAAAAGYTGPGDVVSGASAWWGLRCYNTAYTGNVADVYAPSDASHTLITCSSGGVLNETLQALSTTCATSCTVKTLYDQSGNTNNCNPGSCDFVQATEASRPVYTLNCSASIPCLTFNGAKRMQTANVMTTFFSSPVTVNMTAKRTASFTTAQLAMASGGNAWLGFNSTADNWHVDQAGPGITAGATDSTCHNAHGVYNGASPNSSLTIDAGSAVTGTLTASFSTVYSLGSSASSAFFITGTWREGGLWGSKAFSGTEITNMNSNMTTYGGC